MPALPSPGLVIMVRAVWTVMGKPDQGSRWYYLYTGAAPSEANLGTFGGLLDTQAKAHLLPLINNQCTLNQWELTDLSSPTGAVAVVQSAGAGGDVNNNVSSQTSFVSLYSISRRYRGGHPKTFWPPPGEEAIGNLGQLAPTFITEAQTAVGNVLQSIVAANAGSTTIEYHANVSFYEGFQVVTNPISGRSHNVPKVRAVPLVDQITAVTIAPYVASQRRRRQLG